MLHRDHHAHLTEEVLCTQDAEENGGINDEDLLMDGEAFELQGL